MNIDCPLCNGNNICEIEKLDIEVIKTYYDAKGFDVRYLFKDNELTCFKCLDCETKFFRPIVEGDNDFYALWQSEDWYFLHENKTEFEYSKKYIKPTDKVLDIGSGRGVFKKYINCKFYQGLEFSQKAVELAKKDGVNVIAESIQEHCLKNPEYYDVVVIFQVLEHIVNISDFMNSALKCLKKDGILIIAVPNNDSFIKSTINNYLNIPPHHQSQFTETSLKKLASLYNIEVIDVFKKKVTNIHKDFFYNVLKWDIYNKLTNNPYKMTEDQSLKPGLHGYKKIISKSLISLAKLIKYHKYKDGQTIIYTYKK